MIRAGKNYHLPFSLPLDFCIVRNIVFYSMRYSKMFVLEERFNL